MTIHLLAVLDNEIDDRTVQANESGEAEEYEEELKALQDLKKKVEAQQPLSYNEYEWLADLSAGQREQETRNELE